MIASNIIIFLNVWTRILHFFINVKMRACIIHVTVTIFFCFFFERWSDSLSVAFNFLWLIVAPQERTPCTWDLELNFFVLRKDFRLWYHSAFIFSLYFFTLMFLLLHFFFSFYIFCTLTKLLLRIIFRLQTFFFFRLWVLIFKNKRDNVMLKDIELLK